jgi:hypothetical protein
MGSRKHISIDTIIKTIDKVFTIYKTSETARADTEACPNNVFK